MVERTYSESVVREAEEIEAYKLGLLQSGKDLASKELDLPDQQIAALSDLETQAAGKAGQTGGIGGYRGLAQGGRGTLGTGLGTMGQALGALGQASPYMGQAGAQLGQAAGTLAGSYGQYGGGPTYTAGEFQTRQGPAALDYGAQGFRGGPTYTAGQYGIGSADLGPQSYAAQSFDPSSVSAYMNPYEGQAVQQALGDIRRQGDIAANQQNAAAVQAGAFGGSRQGLQSAELGRNVLEQQAKTAVGMRQAGYQNAMQQAQGNFADQQRRAQAQAQFGTSAGLQSFEDAQRRRQAQAQFGTSTGLQSFEEQQRRAQAQSQFGSSYAQQGFQAQQQAQQQAFEDAQRRRQAQSQFGTQQGQQAYEDAMRRQQAASQQQQGIASMYGNLANTQSALAGQYGNIGQAQANMGVQQLNAAQQAQAQGLQEMQAMQTMGGLQRQTKQAALNADFQNKQRQMYEPMTRLSWLSDIYKGAPSSTSSIGSQVAPSAPAPSMFQQFGALGTGLLGAAAAGKAGGLF